MLVIALYLISFVYLPSPVVSWPKREVQRKRKRKKLRFYKKKRRKPIQKANKFPEVCCLSYGEVVVARVSLAVIHLVAVV